MLDYSFIMDNYLKLNIENYRKITVIGIDRLEARLEKYLGSRFSKVISFIIIVTTRFTPINFIPFLPKSICSIFGSSAVKLDLNEKRILAWINRSSKSKYTGHQKASFFLKMNYYFKNLSDVEFENYIQNYVMKLPLTHNIREFYKLWLFHFGSHALFSNDLKVRICILEKTDDLSSNNSPRFLPEHTTNMGHLALLFLYANFYRKIDPNRQVVIWPEISPNKLYLNKLLETFPIKFKLLPGKPDTSQINFNDIDTLTLSRINPGNWRYETGSCFPCDQEFPEYFIEPEFKLNNLVQLTQIEMKSLTDLGFDIDKWFVILHVKEHMFGYINGGETRDCSILNFIQACRLIEELGGQVIRMGSPNFPKLSPDYPAIDYAHSNVRSERIDYWLWANCRYWIGNGNGASFAVIPFNKPRLVSNVWPINPIGPAQDFYLPKLVYSRKLAKILSPAEMLQIKISRSMKKNLFVEYGFDLIDNSEELIRSATSELHYSLERKTNKPIVSDSDFNTDFHRSAGIINSKSVMKLPSSFKDFFFSF